MAPTLMPDVLFCEVEGAVPPEVIEQWTAIPGDWEPSESVFCEIQSGHTGPHVALGESEDDESYQAWWLIWSDGSPAELVRIAPCESAIGEEADDPHDEEICVLPDGHEGLHTGGFQWWKD